MWCCCFVNTRLLQTVLETRTDATLISAFYRGPNCYYSPGANRSVTCCCHVRNYSPSLFFITSNSGALPGKTWEKCLLHAPGRTSYFLWEWWAYCTCQCPSFTTRILMKAESRFITLPVNLSAIWLHADTGVSDHAPWLTASPTFALLADGSLLLIPLTVPN